MLKRGRNLNKVTLEHYADTFMKGEVSHSLKDFIACLKFWDYTPILVVYFDDTEIKE